MNNETNLNGLIKRMIQFIVPNQINAYTVGDTDMTHTSTYSNKHKNFSKGISTILMVYYLYFLLFVLTT